ncbi:SpoIIIAH-like family protein [Haloimpatiens lingqiaonensis]|uniref:SpoIIIAH-like family protein n=1 Tax=Haloimpatiens lingqiaonensis TaxID=1380675 RepID=UPI001484E813|nr:SpoIIIAH-like family protein [Haloimpatiens lingqiaonensis]
MNKKQAIIIATLLVLIVCLGMVATKVNTSVISKSGGKTGEKSAISFNNNQKEESKSNYFTESKMLKEERTIQTLEELKSIIDDEKIDKEQKSKVIEEFKNISTNADKENKIEIALKGKGFEDVVCMIEKNNKVRVIVKSSKKLSDKQAKEIQDVVMSVTGSNNVEIENKE